MNRSILCIGGVVVLLAGCGHVPERNAAAVATAVDEVVANHRRQARVEVVDKPFVRAERVPYLAPRGNAVSMVTDGLTLNAALDLVAQQAGFSVAFAEDVDRSRRVKMTLRDVAPDAAVRDLAFAAGYVALFESSSKVTVASRGSVTFKVPTHMLDAIQAKYDVANSPDSTSGGQQGGGSGAGAGGTSGGAAGSGGSGTASLQQTRAQANVKGAVTTGSDVVAQFLRGVVGADAQISVLASAGLVTVRGDAQQLRRAGQVLDRMARNASAQVDVRLAVVEVSLTSENQFGIDWTKVVPLSSVLPSGAARVALNTARITDPALSATVTTNSISSVVQALSQRNAVRVVKEPRVRALNNTMAILRTGTQEPILASLKSDVSGQSGTVTTTATFQYVQDGESIAVVPNVIDGETVELTIIPTFSNISAFREFTVGNIVAKLPATPLTEGSINLIAQNDRTVIVGGTRIDSSTKDLRGLPGVVDLPLVANLLSGSQHSDKSREVVLLVHTNIQPGLVGAQIVAEAM